MNTTESDHYLIVDVQPKHIKWSKHEGHANDPLCIALREIFGMSKYVILFGIGGFYHSHRRLTVITHDYESAYFFHSYELKESAQRTLWRWFNKETIYPFQCKIIFTPEQINIIKECQRIHRVNPIGLDKLKPTKQP